MARLDAFLGELVGFVPCFEAWIDGSFVTAKLEPGDIDLTIVIEGEVFDRLQPAAQEALQAMFNGNFSPDLHLFFVITRSSGHADFAATAAMQIYWAQWWSVGRDGFLKGMPVLRVGETSVGLRLLS